MTLRSWWRRGCVLGAAALVVALAGIALELWVVSPACARRTILIELVRAYESGRKMTSDDRLLESLRKRETVDKLLQDEISTAVGDKSALLTAARNECKLDGSPWESISSLFRGVTVKVPNLCLASLKGLPVDAANVKVRFEVADATGYRSESQVTVTSNPNASPQRRDPYTAERSEEGRFLFRKPLDFRDVPIGAKELLVVAGARDGLFETLSADRAIKESTDPPEKALGDAWLFEKVWAYRFGYLALSAALMLAIGWLTKQISQYVRVLDKAEFGVPLMMYVGAVAVVGLGSFGFVKMLTMDQEAGQVIAGIVLFAVLVTAVVFASVQVVKVRQAMRELQ